MFLFVIMPMFLVTSTKNHGGLRELLVVIIIFENVPFHLVGIIFTIFEILFLK